MLCCIANHFFKYSIYSNCIVFFTEINGSRIPSDNSIPLTSGVEELTYFLQHQSSDIVHHSTFKKHTLGKFQKLILWLDISYFWYRHGVSSYLHYRISKLVYYLKSPNMKHNYNDRYGAKYAYD
ncbi:hypothetical protein RF11_00833 [Thelohanellus kitauei]|uniref:Uncharacterized protein n=1 Tax=Thelohanellus kitauei TaxID=669202 RepID=A0A0C2MQY6_THEKT|nr:hypothetical protein RF11_00833 [Thelohanellus kitauei]